MPENAQFGQYIVSEQIGKGGMATVYKAHHARLDRYVAIKVMHTIFLQDDSFRTRFEREARIVARLEHPNIVPIYDYSEQDGNPYLVMKCIDGVTLKQRALKSGVTLTDVQTLMTPIAEALDYAHRQGVLHRDMKPSNILIDPVGKPYLTDFGLARMAQVGESTISHDMMLGTPFYISPEQAQGQRDLTSATDIYSFGIIIYELLTGTVPFAGDSAYAIVHGHIYSSPVPPSEVNPSLPRAVDAVLMKALAKKPEERYATAADMMADFSQAIGIQPARPMQGHEKPMMSQPMADTPTIQERKPKVQTSIDLGQIDWDRIGDRIGQWGERIGATFDTDSSDSQKRRKSSEMELSDEEQIRRRIKKRREEFAGLVTHFFIYAMVNSIIWILAIVNSDPGDFPWGLMFMTGGWGIGMFSHAWEYYSKFGPGAARHEAEVERELERELAKRGQKSKNVLDDERLIVGAEGLRLTDDGEFTDSYVEEIQGKRARQRRS